MRDVNTLIHAKFRQREDIRYIKKTLHTAMPVENYTALVNAARKVRDKMFRIAGHMLEVSPGDLEVVPGEVRVKGVPSKSIPVKELARAAVWSSWKLPKGKDPGLEATHYYDPPPCTYANATHIAEVEVDPETGVIDVVKYTFVNDFGVVINPLLVDGQAHGGIVQGIGQCLRERTVYDEDGQLLTGSFMDYAMPRAGDLCAIELDNNPVPTQTNPLGVKGAGEAGAVGAMPAVANALVDALSPLGIRHVEMPATPEVLWRTIRAARQG